MHAGREMAAFILGAFLCCFLVSHSPVHGRAREKLSLRVTFFFSWACLQIASSAMGKPRSEAASWREGVYVCECACGCTPMHTWREHTQGWWKQGIHCHANAMPLAETGVAGFALLPCTLPSPHPTGYLKTAPVLQEEMQSWP